MSKKPTALTPSVVEHATVSNNINLNLNQNDLIDLAIQEHLEMLEGKLKSVKEEIDLKTKQVNELKKNAAKAIVEKALKKDLSYNKFIELFEALGLKPEEDDEEFDPHRRSTYPPYVLNPVYHTTNMIGQYSEYGGEDYPNLSSATRNIREKHMYKNTFDTVSVNLRYNENGINLSYHKAVDITPADTKELCKKIDPIDLRIYELKKQKFDLQKEFFEYTFGEKRVKAKIVKATLKKSVEGQTILTMLQGATGVKFLE